MSTKGLPNCFHLLFIGLIMCVEYIGDRTFARGDTRPYWTLGRKDSRALDARPVGH